MPTPSKSLEISRGTRAPRIAPSEPPESVSSAESCDPCPSLPSTCQVRATADDRAQEGPAQGVLQVQQSFKSPVPRKLGRPAS